MPDELLFYTEPRYCRILNWKTNKIKTAAYTTINKKKAVRNKWTWKPMVTLKLMGWIRGEERE